MGASRTVRSTFGWVDSKSGEPVDDKDIKGKYQQDIITYAGEVCHAECDKFDFDHAERPSSVVST